MSDLLVLMIAAEGTSPSCGYPVRVIHSTGPLQRVTPHGGVTETSEDGIWSVGLRDVTLVGF
jgi:hypothetical protein